MLYSCQGYFKPPHQKGTEMEQRRIEKIEERLEKLERTCGETEPIKVTRIEIDISDVRERFNRIDKRQADTERTLDNHTAFLKDVSSEQDVQSDLLQKIFIMVSTQNTDIAVLKHEMQGARADITSIKATQSDHGELFKEHSQRFDRIEAAMATKEDLAALKTTQDEHGGLLRSQGEKLDLILQLLQKKGE
jgi:chromosome segregation ATPase